jgi:hypothetical protein
VGLRIEKFIGACANHHDARIGELQALLTPAVAQLPKKRSARVTQAQAFGMPTTTPFGGVLAGAMGTSADAEPPSFDPPVVEAVETPEVSS